jgi:hypothetical protein
MEKFVEPLPPYRFLVDAFFRLHRRRQIGQHGIQPIPYGDMADYAERVLRLPDSLRAMYFAAMEATDNGVLYDHYEKQKADTEAMKQEAAQKRRSPRSRPRKA